MNIPPRKCNAMSGSNFAATIMGVTGAARENAIATEILNGNIPEFMRMQVHVAAISKELNCSLTYTVIPRFLAIGSDEDHFYIPMAPTTAQIIVDSFGAMLPTYKMVQDIFSFASFRQIATTFKWGPQMSSTDYYKKHSDIVIKQLETVPLQALCDGYKKNVVISKKMETKKDSVFIYGWMKDQAGNFWQGLPLFPGHSKHYADYSHGIRLVDRKMTLANLEDETTSEVDGLEVLQDNVLNVLLSAEGPILHSRY